jgi:hypothetical protein
MRGACVFGGEERFFSEFFGVFLGTFWGRFRRVFSTFSATPRRLDLARRLLGFIGSLQGVSGVFSGSS